MVCGGLLRCCNIMVMCFVFCDCRSTRRSSSATVEDVPRLKDHTTTVLYSTDQVHPKSNYVRTVLVPYVQYKGALSEPWANPMCCTHCVNVYLFM